MILNTINFKYCEDHRNFILISDSIKNVDNKIGDDREFNFSSMFKLKWYSGIDCRIQVSQINFWSILK